MTDVKAKDSQLLARAAREFSRKALFPEREESDRYPFGPFCRHLLEKAFDLDFFHVTLPDHLGGIGLGIRELCVLLDAVCQEDSSLGGVIFTHTLAQEILLEAGEQDLLERLTAGAKGVDDFLIACPALVNPAESGQPATARQKNGGWHLSGEVPYVVLGGVARHALVPAAVQGQGAFSYFLVDLAEGSVQKSEPVFSHGMRACPAVDLTLTQTPATPVGEIGSGENAFGAVFSRMQLAAGAMACGIMKGSFQEALAYCRQRKQGGRIIKDWSLMQMMLADMAMKVEVADLLITRAGEVAAGKEPGWERQVQAASFQILSAAAELASDGVQALGGVGYMKDFGQEKRLRDAGQVQALLGIFPMKKIRFFKTFFGGKKE